MKETKHTAVCFFISCKHVYLIKWNNSWKGLALSNKEGVACGPFGLTAWACAPGSSECESLNVHGMHLATSSYDL